MTSVFPEILVSPLFLPLAILYYDHFLTLRKFPPALTAQGAESDGIWHIGPEIKHLWKRKKSHSAYWFFLNRYFAFLANLSVTILGFTTLPLEVRPFRFPPCSSLTPASLPLTM
jgi:hypothetical protein